MIKIIRFDESNENKEALKGKWGQEGQKSYSVTVIKNIVYVVLYSGCKAVIELPECYDGFIILSNGSRIQVKNSKLTANLPSGVTGQGILALKAWN